MDSFSFPKGSGTIIPDDELQQPVNAYFTPPKEKNYPVEWIVIWKDETKIGVSMKEQAVSQKMTLTDYRVRDYLIGTIGIKNCVYVNQTEVAKELNVHRVTVCESIKRLCEMGVLVKGPKAGKSGSYMVNPAFCFFGGLGDGVKKRREAIKKGKLLPLAPAPRDESKPESSEA